MAIQSVTVNGTPYSIDYATLANKPEEIPQYTTSDNDSLLAVNHNGNGLEWVVFNPYPIQDRNDVGKFLRVASSEPGLESVEWAAVRSVPDFDGSDDASKVLMVAGTEELVWTALGERVPSPNGISDDDKVLTVDGSHICWEALPNIPDAPDIPTTSTADMIFRSTGNNNNEGYWDYGGEFMPSPDSDAGVMQLLRHDGSGNVDWNQVDLVEFLNIDEASNGDVLALGDSGSLVWAPGIPDPNGAYQGDVLMYNEDGGVSWGRELPYADSTDENKVLAVDDNGHYYLADLASLTS